MTLRELIDTCLRNCANSYRVLALESGNVPQVGIMAAHAYPNHAGYVANVLELDVHIPDSWKNDAIKKEETALEKANNLLDVKMPVLFSARRLHHAVLELLIERKDLDTAKIPRTLID